MAVYKLFPTQDATLYSLYPIMNTGLDEIIECSTTAYGYGEPNPQVSRFLIKFSQNEINSVFATKINPITNNWKSYLRCFIADVEGLNVDTEVETWPLAKNWDNGTGKYLDDPVTTNGASWLYNTYYNSTQWISGIPAYATASYTSSVLPGGGVWYTASTNPYYPSVSASQTYALYSDLDLNLNVTNIVHNWYSSSIGRTGLPNYGFIVKQINSQEFINNLDQQVNIKFFSIDTNTIYPPVLEFRWDDFSYATGSSGISVINNPQVYVSLANNPGTFYSESVQRFRLNVRPQFPPVIFQTASIYTTNYYLPTASYYAIQDLDTNLYVVPFDSTYTKISADTTSSYFNVYMNGLEPQRNYKILIQTTIDGTTMVLDNYYTFKVVN
jgi:hypothetical protein